MKRLSLFLSLLLVVSSALAQPTVTIDKLDRTAINQSSKRSGYSTLVEGTVTDPDAIVYVLVKGQNANGWRFFPASIDPNAPAKGVYRWRAICLFGRLNGKGIGETNQIQAVVMDKETIDRGLLPQAITKAVKSETISIKRTK